MKRRSVIAALSTLSLGATSPSLAADQVFKEPYKLNKKKLNTDILVVGGGTAGVVAALQAARAGRQTILVENGSQLGGTITTGGVSFPGIFFAWGEQIISGIGWEMVQEAVALNDDTLPDFSIPHGKNHPRHQVRLNGQLYALLLEEKCMEADVQLRFYETPTQIVPQKNGWLVETIGKGIITEIICNQLIDCTGNAYVTSMAGFNVFRESVTQPGSLMFQIGGYDFNSLDINVITARYQEAIRKGKLEKPDFRNNIVGVLRTKGDNISHVLGADSTTSETHTAANIKGRSALLKTLRFIRTLPGCEKTKIIDVQNETAVRETYRIDGHYKISEADYVTGKVFEDSVSYSYYPIDLHDEKGVVPVQLKNGMVPTIPLRALIPKNSRNFLVAGRCISSDRLANSALRVQASCMGMGQAAGAVAVLANLQNKTPLDVPMNDLRKLLEDHGAIVPVTHRRAK